MPKTKNLFPFILVTSLFFLWAFLHNINPILIPHLKKACELTDTQSSFIDMSVYLAYFIVAIPAGLLMQKAGYKKSMILGLTLYAVGAFLFLPAAAERNYLFFLIALFIIASGATFLEAVANPYIAVLGDTENSAQRLNFAQSFNGLGSFIAPIIGGRFILTGIEHSPAEMHAMQGEQIRRYLQFEADTVKTPYAVIGISVLLLIILFIFTNIPDVRSKEDEHVAPGEFSMKVFRHSHLKWSVIAQFFYVGAQVGVGSFFIRYARFVANVSEKDAAFLWGAIAMVGFMGGRFIGTFLMKFFAPAKMLAWYSGANIVLLLLALVAHGEIALYAVISVPFFMSIMYPTIFALGIKDLGEETKIASSFLVMSIIGGACSPLVMGVISDRTGSIQVAYIIPLLCFCAVLYYGIWGHRVIPNKI